MFDAVVVEPAQPADSAVIWLHGLGASGHAINGFVDKVSGVLGKIGINIDLPKLREFGNVSFGLAEQKVASLTAPAVKSPADTVSSLLAGQQQMQKQVGQAVMNNTFNISGNTGKPQEVAQKTVEALRQYNRTSGALNRVLTIE